MKFKNQETKKKYSTKLKTMDANEGKLIQMKANDNKLNTTNDNICKLNKINQYESQNAWPTGVLDPKSYHL